MALTEIEFDLPAEQFEQMGYPSLQQGHSLTLQVETSVLEPDWAFPGWYTVQQSELPVQFVRVGRAQYAFAGQITDADLAKTEGIETAAVIVQCGDIPLRVLCAPRDDGSLPYGTWETRYLTGAGRIHGIVEDDFAIGVGRQIDVTVWSFRRLVLRPGDARFGEWHETTELAPAPFQYDRVVVTARVHRRMF